MIGNFKPYPAYKNSGVSSLGKVPEHWDVRRLGQIGRLFKGSGGSKDDETQDGVPCIRYGDLYTTHDYFIESSRSFVSDSKAQDYMPIRFGDVLFAASGETIDEIAKSAVNLLRTEVCCGSDIILFRNECQVEAGFLGYLMDCRASVVQKAMMGRGITIIHIYKSQLKRLVVCLPPLLEQAAIVRFLNHIDQHIDHYIHTKQELIKLLEEKKKSIIHRTVQRGLDPDVHLSPSGVSGLEDVPRHWSVRRLRTVCEMRISNVDKYKRDNELPVRLCNYVDVYKNERIKRGLAFMPATATKDEIERFRLRSGDVLITKDSETWNDIGVPALVEESENDLVSGYHLALLRPLGEHLHGPYLFRVLQTTAVSHQLHVAASGVTRYGLSNNSIKSVWLPVPPLSEQIEIAFFLEKKIAGIDVVVKATQRYISLLQDYRTRLISDVVTGKLDVREAAAQLPKQLSETGSVDVAHAPPHMSTGSNRDSDASTEEDEP